MKKTIVVLLVLVLMLLMACGSEDGAALAESNSEEVVEEEMISPESEEEGLEEEVSDEFETTVGETVTNEGGSFTLLARATDIPTQEDGPMILNIPQVNTAYGELSGDLADFMDTDAIHYIQIDMEVENTSEETITFHASQATITTNTGEQLESDMWLSDHLDGTYIGEIRKSGSQFFILENSSAEEIEWVRIIISSPTDENYDRLGEGIDFRVEL